MMLWQNFHGQIPIFELSRGFQTSKLVALKFLSLGIQKQHFDCDPTIQLLLPKMHPFYKYGDDYSGHCYAWKKLEARNLGHG